MLFIVRALSKTWQSWLSRGASREARAHQCCANHKQRVKTAPFPPPHLSGAKHRAGQQGRAEKGSPSALIGYIVRLIICSNIDSILFPCTYILCIFSTISVKIIMDSREITIILPVLLCLNGICFVQINHGIPGWWRNGVQTNEEVQPVNAGLFLCLF